MSESTTDHDAANAEAGEEQRDGSDKEALIDKGARLAGVALVLAVVLPFRTRHDVKMIWDAHVDPSILAAMGVLSVVFLIASFSRPSVRRAGIAFAGFGLGAAALGFLLEDGSVRGQFRQLTVAAGGLGCFAWFFTVGAERAMAAAPRSRSLTGAAALGWFTVLCLYAVPFEQRGEFRSTILGAIGHAMDRDALKAWALALPGILAMVGFVQCLRRLGSDRALAAERWFKAPWLSRLLLAIPLGAAVPLALFFGDRNAARIAIIAFAFCYAIALAVQASLELLERVPRGWVIRAGVVITLLGALATMAPRWQGEGAVEELANAVGHEIDGVLRGGLTDPEFHGGYSDSDLRATDLSLPESAVLEAVALRVIGVAPRDDQAWAVMHNGTVEWTCGDRHDAYVGITSWSEAVAASFLVREDLSDATRQALGDPQWLPRTHCEEWQSEYWETFGSRGAADHALIDRAVLVYREGDELRSYTSGLGNIREYMWIATAFECPDGDCRPLM